MNLSPELAARIAKARQVRAVYDELYQAHIRDTLAGHLVSHEVFGRLSKLQLAWITERDECCRMFRREMFGGP